MTTPVNTPGAPKDPDAWPETLATVLTCTYESRAGLAIAFGYPSSKHFHITYNYWANDQLHTADIYTEKPIPQGTLFPIRYNPEQPHRSHHANAGPNPRAFRIALGIAGSVIFSLGWLLFLHGCQH